MAPPLFLKLIEWQLPLACIIVILVSTLYTHHSYYQHSSETQLMQDLASMQIMGILLAAAALSAIKAATSARNHRPSHYTSPHPMLPPVAARRRQQMPLV